MAWRRQAPDPGKGRMLQTVEKALRLLNRLAQPPGVLGVTELSKDLGLSKSVTYSLLSTLRKWGFVQQDSDHKYKLGIQLLVLGQFVHQSLQIRNLALPVLRRVAQCTGESTYLMLLTGDKGTLIERADPPSPLRVTMEVGEQGELHAGSSPKVMLAFLPDFLIERFLYHRPLRRFTARTVTDPEILRQQLADIRRVGYAYTEEESFEGIAGLAAPIFDSRGAVVASVGVAGLIQRLRPRIAEIAPVVKDAAAEISGALGYRLDRSGYERAQEKGA